MCTAECTVECTVEFTVLYSSVKLGTAMIKQRPNRGKTGRDSVLKWTDRQTLQSANIGKQSSGVISCHELSLTLKSYGKQEKKRPTLWAKILVVS